MPYVNNQGVRIYYEVEGKGPPLVLQHGFTVSLESWRDYGYTRGLRDDYQLILIDARGHGQSDKPHAPSDYEMPRRVSDLVAVLDDLNVRAAHYLGYSMGGRMGFGVAKYAPERFHSLLIGGMHPYTSDRASLDQRAQSLQQGMAAVVAALEEQFGLRMTPQLKARMLANDAAALIASTLEWRDWPGLEEVLPTMPLPCLLWAGDADELYPGIKRCVQQIPAVTFVSLPGLDHGEAFMQSTLVLPHIVRFLATMT